MEVWGTYISSPWFTTADTSSVSSLSQHIIAVFAGFSETYASLSPAQDVLSSPLLRNTP